MIFIDICSLRSRYLLIFVDINRAAVSISRPQGANINEYREASINKPKSSKHKYG